MPEQPQIGERRSGSRVAFQDNRLRERNQAPSFECDRRLPRLRNFGLPACADNTAN
jgi:hypothetical protein